MGEIIYVQKSSFFEEALPVFIGAVLAFLFSILVFWLTEKLKRSQQEQQLEQNVFREMRFNINFLDKYKNELDRLIQKVIANDPSSLFVFKFDKLQRTFLLEAFNKGILYQILSDEEINTIDSMLGFFFTTTNDYLSSLLQQFRGGNMTAAQLLPILQFNVDETVRYRDFLELIQKRFKQG